MAALKQLAGNSGYHFQLLNAVIEVNELQKRRVIAKLQKHLGSLVGKEIALLGLAFKPNTDDMREASSLVLVGAAAGGGRARARVRPRGGGGGAQADPRRAARVLGASEAIAGADAVVLVTEWPSSRRSTSPSDRAAMRGSLLVDGRNFLDPEAARAAGLTYEAVGRAVRRTGSADVQALILAGGEGTRLRPLTSTVPKPVVPLVDRPFIAFMLDWLHRHDVDDVVMCCGHLAAGVRNVLGDGSAFGVRLRYVEEPRPLGTGGAMKFAESLLDERFLMLNGDVLSDIDVSAQIARHEAAGARATLTLTPVEDPSAYGLVRTATDGAGHRVRREAVARPDRHAQHQRRRLRARARVLDMLEPGEPASIERDVFPRLVGEGLYAHVGDGYWRDIGTPAGYLEGTYDILEGTVRTGVAERMGDGFLCVEDGVESDGRIIPAALVESGCRIGEGARVGGRAVLEHGVTIGAHTTVERAVVMRGAEIGANCTLRGCIVAGGVRIGDNTRVEGLAVLGEGVTIGADNVVTNGARIFPGVTIPDGGLLF